MKAERRTMAPGTARNTASRTSPLVAVEMPSRASNAVLTVASREARDIEISLASDFVGRGALSGFGDEESRWGETFDPVAASSSANGSAEWPPDDRLRRMTQYSVALECNSDLAEYWMPRLRGA